MNKILVIGSGGAGKSTVARSLGQLLHIPVIHLDRLYWRAGWVETPKTEWRQTVADLIQGDAWIIDGNYSGTLDIRMTACDTVLFLDLSRTLCLWRAAKRKLIYRRELRPDMAAGCPEKFDLQFMRWIWDYPKRTRPKVLQLLSQCAPPKVAIRLRSRTQIEAFLTRVTASSEPSVIDR